MGVLAHIRHVLFERLEFILLSQLGILINLQESIERVSTEEASQLQRKCH
jgi:hypothetical protein